ncbi:UNVERIFIED_CONTAM: hypothetical protein FKN15_018491 [Acipenser sinensis]
MAAVRSLQVSVKPDIGSDRSESDSESEPDRDPREPEPMEVEEGELQSISVQRSLKDLLPEPIEEEEEEEEDMDEDERVVEYREERERERGFRSTTAPLRRPSPPDSGSDSDEMDYDLELKMISTPSPKKSMKMTMYADEVESKLKTIRNSMRSDTVVSSNVKNRIGSGSKTSSKTVTDVRLLLEEKRQNSTQQHPLSSTTKTDVRQRLGKRPHSPDSRAGKVTVISPAPVPRREPLSDVHSRLGTPRQDPRGLYSENSKDKKPGWLHRTRSARILAYLVQRYPIMDLQGYSTQGLTEELQRVRMRPVLHVHKSYVTDVEFIWSLMPRDQCRLCLVQVFRVVSVCLGSPPSTFTWEYRDKEKNFHRLGPLSPLQFYREHVKPLYNIEDKICLVNDPRPQNPYNKLYGVEFLGNMVGGRGTNYNNQAVEVLKKAAADSIKDGEAVWFGCDVGKHFHGKLGINDMDVFNHELVFGISVKNLSKAERLIFGDSLMTHAMVLTAVTDKLCSIESWLADLARKGRMEVTRSGELRMEGKEGGYEKWRVENSWGDDRGNKGYLIMTDDWFSEYVYEVVVDKKHLSTEVLEVTKQEPVILPAWDPMGALA